MDEDAIDRCQPPQTFWRALRRRGIDPATVLRRAALPASLPLNPEAYVSAAQLFAIWRAVAALSGDAGLGISLATAGGMAERKPTLLAASYAATYREALQRLAGFKRYGGCFRLEFDEGDGLFSIAKHRLFADEPEPPLAADAGFASLLALGRSGTGRYLVPIRLDLEQPRPVPDDHHRYFGCAIRYGAPRNLLVLRSGDVDLPLLGGNPELFDLVAGPLERPAERLSAIGLGERAKRAIGRDLEAGRLSLAAVAARLGMSSRTLQRRLAGEGLAFRTLVRAVRRERRARLRADRSARIDGIASSLGYRTGSAFCRAFREWDGTTPRGSGARAPS